MNLTDTARVPPEHELQADEPGGFRPMDPDIAQAFQDVYRALGSHPFDLAAALHSLEIRVGERLERLHSEAYRIADANVSALEIIDRQTLLAAEAQHQNLLLAQHSSEIEAQHENLSTQCAAAADATVEAVLLLEDSAQRLDALEQAHSALEQTCHELELQTCRMAAEAAALAESNVEATFLLDARSTEVQELRLEHEKISQENRVLEHLATVDPTTGLFNRRYFRELLRREVSRSRRTGRPLSVLFIDIDHFKQLNDANGHEVGDRALQAVAHLIEQNVRAADTALRTAGQPCAARYGGEEFVVALPETHADGARVVAERLLARIADADIPGRSSQPGGRVTVSCGVASLCGGGCELTCSNGATELVRRADEALYLAKRAGRATVVVAPSPEGPCATAAFE